MVEHILSFIFNFILNLPWGIIATIFASFSPIAIYQYYRRPKPVTGVLPWDEVQKNGLSLEELGNPSTEDEIMFSKDELAHVVSDTDNIGNSERLKRNTRTFFSDGGHVSFPIVFQNLGDKDMEYKVTMTFHEEDVSNTTDNQVRIVNAHTETLEIDGLFCNPEFYEGNKKEKVPHDSIISAYQDMGLPGHFISLDGSLGSGTIEMAMLKLFCPESVTSFYIITEIDSPEWFVEEKVFCQRVSVVHGEA